MGACLLGYTATESRSCSSAKARAASSSPMHYPRRRLETYRRVQLNRDGCLGIHPDDRVNTDRTLDHLLAAAREALGHIGCVLLAEGRLKALRRARNRASTN